jgi:hypothetical protein
LSLPEKKAQDNGGAVDLVDLRGRAAAALASLTADVAALDAVTAGLPGVTPPVRSALLRCSYYGLSGSIPLIANGPDAGLSGQAASVSTVLHQRIAQASALTVATASAADLTAMIQTIFGADFVLLPKFTPPDFASLQSAFGQSGPLVVSDPHAPASWLMQLTQDESPSPALRQAIPPRRNSMPESCWTNGTNGSPLSAKPLLWRFTMISLTRERRRRSCSRYVPIRGRRGTTTC